MRHKSDEKKEQIRAFLNDYISSYGEAPTIREISAGTGISRPTVQRYLVAMGGDGEISYDGGCIMTPMYEKMDNETVPVAILGEVACGLPTYAEEHVESYVKLPRSLVGKNKCFLLRATGESMVEVGVDPGDLVLVRQTNHAEKGQIAVVLVEDEATLKRYYPEPEHGRVRLHPENSEMNDIYVKNATVQGVAFRVIKELR